MSELENENRYIPGNKTEPTTQKTVNALLDEIAFDRCFKEINETEFKVYRDIKCIDYCRVEIIDKDVFTCKKKGEWAVTIVYRLEIGYITEYGTKCKVEKTVEYSKIIPFPLTSPKDDHGLIDFSKSEPYLFDVEVECEKTKFENIDCTIIKAFVEVEFRLVAVIRKAFCVLIAKVC